MIATAPTPAGGDSLLTFLLASIAVIGVTYLATRFLGKWQVTQTKGRRMRVLEGVPIGRDRHLLLVAVGKEVLVLGSCTTGVTLVHRVENPEAAVELMAQRPLEDESAGVPAPVEEAIRQNIERMRALLSRLGAGPHG